MAIKKIDRFIQTEHYKLPIRIFIEYRRSVRASLGKNYVILRIPSFAVNDIEKHIEFTKDWLNKVQSKNPNALDRYQISSVADQSEIKILGKFDYKITITKTESNQGSAKLNDRIISLEIPSNLPEFEQRKMIRDLKSKLLAKVFKPYVVDKIEKLNSKYFQKTIKGVTLRYNATNWGSCSSRGRINISTRGLLLPEEIFEYILVHELSHLIEMNHSKKFWDIVEKIMPDYKLKEKFINSNSAKLDF